MDFEHSSVYIVRVVDVEHDASKSAWYAGPYGRTRAEQVADDLQRAGTRARHLKSRECVVEPLFSNDDCLRVGDYDRATHNSSR